MGSGVEAEPSHDGAEFTRLHHVAVPFPLHERKAICDFYGSVLGLLELPVPSAVADRGALWYSAGAGLELHFFPGDVDASSERHICLSVSDLQDTRARLLEAGRDPVEDIQLPGRQRFFCRDAVGNLIEFTRADDIGM